MRTSKFSERHATFFPSIYVPPRESAAVVQPAIKSALREVDPRAMPGTVIPLAKMAGEAQMLVTVFGLAVGAMAACGISLAMLGIYDVISYGGTRRTREIGLRIPLGARPDQIVRLSTVRRRVSRRSASVSECSWRADCRSSHVCSFGVRQRSIRFHTSSEPSFFGSVALVARWLAARRASIVEANDALRML
jgi:hypothetical protein